jgi:hypothetical protein
MDITSWRLGDGDKATVRFLMGKVHVGRSNFSVAKEFLKRSKDYPKNIRFTVTRYALEQHKTGVYNYDLRRVYKRESRRVKRLYS